MQARLRQRLLFVLCSALSSIGCKPQQSPIHRPIHKPYALTQWIHEQIECLGAQKQIFEKTDLQTNETTPFASSTQEWKKLLEPLIKLNIEQKELSIDSATHADGLYLRYDVHQTGSLSRLSLELWFNGSDTLQRLKAHIEKDKYLYAAQLDIEASMSMQTHCLRGYTLIGKQKALFLPNKEFALRVQLKDE